MSQIPLLDVEMGRNLRAINYFGSKVANAHRYPYPRHDTIIEPFAGGAGYSLFHHTRSVVLIDKDPDIIGAWQFLISGGPAEVLALPLIDAGQSVDDLDCSSGGRLLISWCLNQTATPRKKLSSWAVYHNERNRACYWNDSRRAQCAMIAGRVAHWFAVLGDYREALDENATWFIDPPYVDGGASYRHRTIDYPLLAEWCRTRRGQVIVCERAGADWLPFAPLYDAPTSRRYLAGARKRCAEAVWTNG